MSIWYRNGQWGEGEIALPVDDVGVFQGVIAVERLRTYSGRWFRLDDHLDRLRQSTSLLSIDAAQGIDGLSASMADLLHRNGAPLVTGGTVLITPGTLRGRTPTVIAHLTPLDLARIERLQKEGELLVLSSVVQPSANSVPRRVKHRSRLHYYLAAQQVRRVDPAATAVLIDDDGSVTETASANILLVQDGSIYSAPPDRVLPGVSLGVVRQLANEAGIPWIEQPLQASMFDRADEILLTGTGAGIWFGNNRKGPVYRQLSEAFHASTASFD
ncbi:Branched-chain-amino-acid aminotransferase [Rosistilla ulvae]|uniref:Branched-chain-amino-acid aminotransferase n=1 Tax=Rosistilla ulvae TaxID=1930277 RepID=A0A517M6T5_9BACT|nr:aminotransferase class IV [Rosistilla ulvae]QDS90588.1 Branched-chain-amino-acid aminotransferase [Rosistilla ulvae]